MAPPPELQACKSCFYVLDPPHASRFSPPSIEVQCREQGVHLRSKVYTHLSSFLPCSRDTLLKRVKKLFLAHRVSSLLNVLSLARSVVLLQRFVFVTRFLKYACDKEDPPDVDDSLQKLREAVSRAMPEQIERFELSCVVYEQVKASRYVHQHISSVYLDWKNVK